ncbi:MAG: class I SAM-dependent methyltransferase [Candidatus Electrothrix sp. AUS3]|nr:class I SAM-dependent methyltransferase [Candidatus Electrothrix gigas]
MKNNLSKEHQKVQSFYDSTYYRETNKKLKYIRHFRSLSRKIGLKPNQKLLDVACGRGEWLFVATELDVKPSGVDISEKAIKICKEILPKGDFHVSVAEKLPFEKDEFDVISCLGAIEHFLDPLTALQEMSRVAHEQATFLFLVPNAGFLTHRSGFFQGTDQTNIHEEPLLIHEWEALFQKAGFKVEAKWRDLHILSPDWILASRWWMIPFRLAQAVSLLVWPMSWQYQIYFHCSRRPE